MDFSNITRGEGGGPMINSAFAISTNIPEDDELNLGGDIDFIAFKPVNDCVIITTQKW